MKARITVYLCSPDPRQRRPYYQLQWTHPLSGRRKTRSSKTANPVEAEALRGDLECKLNEGLDVDQGQLGWPEFRQKYQEDKLAYMRESSRKKVRTVLKRLEQHVQLKSLKQLDAPLLQRHANWLKARGYKPVSIAGHLTHIRAALSWGQEQGLLAQVPAVPRIPVPRKMHIRRITDEEWGRLLGACACANFRELLLTGWHSGLRLAELWALSWSSPGLDSRGEQRPLPWVDLEGGRILLPAEFCKSTADSWVPLHPELRPVLAARRQPAGVCFPLSPDQSRLSKLFRKLADSVGLHGVTLHDVRRTFGCRYAARVPAHILQRLMRHASLTTTLRYYVDLDPSLHDAINLL